MDINVKNKSLEELISLSSEIRKKLIDVVSKNGGHLGPNLGVVELTVALHKVFDSPKDKILWDVGHQSYVHKILTGRLDRFDTIRKKSGLSPFCDRNESKHDHFISGHAGNILAAASGIAEVHKESKVIAVVGDASFAVGENLEALNLLGGEKRKNVIIILNDNEMSIGKNVGALSKTFRRIIDSKFYNHLKRDVENTLRKGSIGNNIADIIKRLEGSVRQFITPGSVLESLGMRYLGPVNGHNFENLFQTFEVAKNIQGPVIIHVKTEKGRGYQPALDNPEKFHGIAPFDTNTGEVYKKSVSYSSIVGKALCKLAEDDRLITAISAGMIKGTGLVEFFKKYKERAYDVGIAEEYAVTFAAALALEGKKPYVAIYSTFLQRAYDQLLHDVAIQKAPVKFLLDRAGIVGADGKTHHGMFDISYLLTIPRMSIVAPTTCIELVETIKISKNFNSGPLSIRFPRNNCFSIKSIIQNFEIGKWFEVEKGEKDLIIATGSMLEQVCDIKEELTANGLKPTIVSAAWIKPFDEKYLLENICEYEHIHVLEENTEVNGFASILLNFLNDNGVLKKINKIGLKHDFIEHASRDEILSEQGLKGSNLVKRILEGR